MPIGATGYTKRKAFIQSQHPYLATMAAPMRPYRPRATARGRSHSAISCNSSLLRSCDRFSERQPREKACCAWEEGSSELGQSLEQPNIEFTCRPESVGQVAVRRTAFLLKRLHPGGQVQRFVIHTPPAYIAIGQGTSISLLVESGLERAL
jgi:hypothetical protein